MNDKTKKKFSRERRLRQQKAARQRQLMRLRMAASLVVLAVAVIAVIAIRGGFEKKAETSTMTIKGTQVLYEEVAPIGELDFSELKDFVRSEVSQATGVRLARISKKKDTAYVRTVYDDMATYSKFTGYEGFLGTVSEADRAGYDFDTAFYAVENGTKGDSVKSKNVKRESDLNVLIIRENGRFCVDGDLVYVSEENSSVVDGSTVDITQNEGEEDTTVLSYIVYKK